MQVILQADQRPKQNHKDENLPSHPQEHFLLGQEFGPMLNQEKYSIFDYEVSKKLIRLLRHGNLPRQDDGAFEFWRMKDNLQKHFPYCPHWSDDRWKKSIAGGGGNNKRYQYCTDSSGIILYLRDLQGHSGRNLIDPSLQDNVLNSERFLRVHLSRRMCNQFTLHHEFRIDTGRTNFEQKTDGILHVCGSHEQRIQRSE